MVRLALSLLTLAAFVCVAGISGAIKPRLNTDNSVAAPGVTRGIGNEATVAYLENLPDFEYLRNVDGYYTDYYVSAAAGGIAAEGDDEAAGTSWATAFKSLCRVDAAIELSTTPVRVWFDSHENSNDEWSDLATELDCKDAAAAYYDSNDPTGSTWDLDDLNWDGSIGPIKPSLVGPGALPVLVVLGSDPANPPDLDFRNLASSSAIDRDQEACTPNGGSAGTNDTFDGDMPECEDADDGLFFCPYAFQGDYTCAASHLSINHYPAAPDGAGRGNSSKDVFSGNWVTTKIRDVAIVAGSQINFSSVHNGGWDLHLSPEVEFFFDSADYDSTCSGDNCVTAVATNRYDEYPLIANCMNNGHGTGCAGAGECESGGAENQPWTTCDATTGNYEALGSIVGVDEGASIIISNQTYDFPQSREISSPSVLQYYDAAFVSVRESSLYMFGSWTITNSNASATTQQAFLKHAAHEDASVPDTLDSTPELIAVGGNITGTWGNTTDNTNLVVITQDTRNTASDTDIAWRVALRDIRVADTNNGFVQIPRLTSDDNGQASTLDLDCIYTVDWDDEWIKQLAPISSSTGTIDIQAHDIYALSTDGGNVWTDGTSSDTTWANAASQWETASDGLLCDGNDTDCSGQTDGVDEVRRIASTGSSDRSACSDTLSVRFPRVNGVQARIPWWVFGDGADDVIGFDFGG